MKLPTLPPDAPKPRPVPPAFGALLSAYLRTPDLDASLRFYVGVLGLPIARTEANPRRYLLALGSGWLALEEAALPEGGWGQGPISQLGFEVADLPALDVVRRRLLAGGVPVSGLLDLGFAQALRFRDPVSGVFLQAAARARAFELTDRFGDPELTPGAAELLGPRPA